MSLLIQEILQETKNPEKTESIFAQANPSKINASEMGDEGKPHDKARRGSKELRVKFRHELTPEDSESDDEDDDWEEQDVEDSDEEDREIQRQFRLLNAMVPTSSSRFASKVLGMNQPQSWQPVQTAQGYDRRMETTQFQVPSTNFKTTKIAIGSSPASKVR
jgi:hypothetical protein